jgi:protein-disulfide isomerase
MSLHPALSENDHVQGSPHAPLELVEYGDYECPACGRAYLVVKGVQRALGSDLRFAFRHFPLAQVHPNAQLAAEAAEAAGAQGLFWEMHDWLFENQEALELEDLLAAAEELGLDTEQFERDLAEHRFEGRVLDNFVSGVQSGINGTPTFFVNGERFDGASTPQGLISALTGSGASGEAGLIE